MSTATAAVKTTVKDVEIQRQGTQIILPPKMSFDEAIEWLRRKREEDERDVGIHHELHYSPLDGAVAFHRAMASKYGWAELVPTPGFFGSTPPTMIGVPVSCTEKLQVPWGRVQIPGVAGFLQTGIAAEPTPRFIISGKVKQKHAAEVKELVDLTEQFLRNKSIYKGSAIKVSFEWQREGYDFDPSVHCPQFMSLGGTNESDLIFGNDVQNAINIGLFTPIEQADACRKYRVPLKRGVLLYGPYGTGKTLTANVTALKSVRNGFTFIYLDNVLDLKKGLQFAAQYAPAVLFAEDIDRVVNGERSLSMDEVLNTLDGVDTKGCEIITVFTTNHVENINPALLRMGRLDTLVEVKRPDAEAAIKLVKLYGRGLLNPKVDYTRVGEKLKDRIPAFIRETLERAKIAAIQRLAAQGKLADGIEGHVQEDDILNAASAMEPHAAMLEPKEKAFKNSPELLVRIPQGHSTQAKKVLASLGCNSDGE
jgi:transitional endoplasmic reticulum ATPase